MSLANLVDPSLKEPWMSFLHQFIMVSNDLHRVCRKSISNLTYSLLEGKYQKPHGIYQLCISKFSYIQKCCTNDRCLTYDWNELEKVKPNDDDDMRDDSRDYIDNAYSKITNQFAFEKLPRTTLEDIPIPPNNIDLPKELSKMTSMITAWESRDVGDRLASISKLCSSLDSRCSRYRKGAMYDEDENSTHSKLSSLSHKGESTMFSCNYSDTEQLTEQSTEQLEVGSGTISSPMPKKPF